MWSQNLIRIVPSSDEASLEIVDLVVGAHPLLAGRESLDPLHQDAPVPGAVENRHPALARQHGPEAPEELVALLVVRRRLELDHAHMARVELGDEALDRPALPAGVPALEDDADRGPYPPLADLPAERQPELLKPRLRRGETLALFLLRERLREIYF